MTILEQAVGFMTERQFGVVDAIEHEGEKLIVVLWFANPDLGLRRPEHVIPLESVNYQVNTTDPKLPRYMLDDPLPKSLFDGVATDDELKEFGVRKGPDVTYPLRSSH